MLNVSRSSGGSAGRPSELSTAWFEELRVQKLQSVCIYMSNFKHIL
jgi:hypothetical protein